jgi:stalled ribosome rescue protein Dom34
VNTESFQKLLIESPKAHTQLHRKSGPGAESGHRKAGDPHFYDEVAKALSGAEEVLVLGPATAKLELIRYVHKHVRDLEPRIVGVETVDHPSDGQLVAYIRRYFEAFDRLSVGFAPRLAS